MCFEPYSGKNLDTNERILPAASIFKKNINSDPNDSLTRTQRRYEKRSDVYAVYLMVEVADDDDDVSATIRITKMRSTLLVMVGEWLLL